MYCIFARHAGSASAVAFKGSWGLDFPVSFHLIQRFKLLTFLFKKIEMGRGQKKTAGFDTIMFGRSCHPSQRSTRTYLNTTSDVGITTQQSRLTLLAHCYYFEPVPFCRAVIEYCLGPWVSPDRTRCMVSRCMRCDSCREMIMMMIVMQRLVKRRQA